MFPSDELLRTLMNDREREIQERIRVRRWTAPRHPIIRWRFGQPSTGRGSERREP